LIHSFNILTRQAPWDKSNPTGQAGNPKPVVSEVESISNNKSQACPRTFWSGIKLKLQITINKKNSYYQVTLSLFEILKIGHSILFVIWFLRFVISSLAKKMSGLHNSGTK